MRRAAHACFSISVRHLGASSCASLRFSTISASLALGGSSLRLATGMPTAVKNSSWPAGVHMQSMWAVLPDTFLNWWGAWPGC